nr:methyltransferase domain-containing protein [Microbacterium humi]
MDLSTRATTLVEKMDEPDCDPRALRRTYRRFTLVNRLVSGWRSVYRSRIRPRLSAERPTRLLDVGCGGGDITLALARWAARDGLQLEVTGVDPDRLAINVAKDAAARGRARARFVRATASQLDERFDIVASNHVVHHIADLPGFLAETTACCTAEGLVLHSDIERSRGAYAGFALLAVPLSPGTFVRVDGLRSIRRSYTAEELRQAAPAGWTVTRHTPRRLLLAREGGDA